MSQECGLTILIIIIHRVDDHWWMGWAGDILLGLSSNDPSKLWISGVCSGRRDLVDLVLVWDLFFLLSHYLPCKNDKKASLFI